MARKKAKSQKKAGKKKVAAKKPARKKAAAKAAGPRKKAVREKKRSAGKLYGLGRIGFAERSDERAESGGQSGDDQGLSRSDREGFESVRNLADEGQAFEAELMEGVEDAPDPDVSEVKTHEVPEDDIPPEYGGDG